MKIISTVCKAGEFILRNLPALIYYVFLIGIASYMVVRKDETIAFSERNMMTAIGLDFIIASGLMIVRGLILLKRTGIYRYIAGFITTSVNLIVGSEVWIILIMRTRWSDRLLRIFLDTNFREASEFAEAGIFTLRSAGVILAYISISWILYDVLRYFSNRISIYIRRGGNKTLTFSVFILFIIGNILSLVNRIINKDYELSAERYVAMVSYYFSLADRINKLEETIPLSDGELEGSSDHPERIIWIIGESDSPYHHPLYGYSRMTTPRINNESGNGNIITFTDVICYVPRTLEMLDILFSPALHTDPEEVRLHTPLVPMIFRKAGYTVRLFDNQSTLKRGYFVDEWGGESFMNSIKLNNANFDYRNDKLRNFDGDFLKLEEPVLRNFPKFCLDIVHINGQHVSFKGRYPGEYSVFKPSDYYDRIDLTHKEHKISAEYDNATLYVDANIGYIIDMIKDQDAILIYVSDHGELVCEEDQKYSRIYMEPQNPVYTPHYVRIPMYVYTTPLFRQEHPDLWARLQSASSRRFSTLYFSHFLMDVAGIKSKYKRKEFSPISDRWADHPRLIWNIGDYDLWMEERK